MVAGLGWAPQEALCHSGRSGHSLGRGSSLMFPNLGLSHVPCAGHRVLEANVETAGWRPGPVGERPRVGAGVGHRPGEAFPLSGAIALQDREPGSATVRGRKSQIVGETQFLNDDGQWSSFFCVLRSQVLALWLPSHRVWPSQQCSVGLPRPEAG